MQNSKITSWFLNYAPFLAIGLLLVTINYPNHLFNNLALIFAGLVSLNFLFNKSHIKKLSSKKIIVLHLALILVYALGLIFTDQVSQGLNVIRLKLPLIAVPILIYTLSFKINTKQVNQLMYSLIYATITLCVYMVYCVAFNKGIINEIQHVNSILKYSHSNLTLKIVNHPSYFSYTIIVCLLFLIKLRSRGAINTVLFILHYLFFCFFIIILLSKVAILLVIILTMYYAQKELGTIKGVILNILFIVTMVFLAQKTDLGYRFSEEIESVKHSRDLKDKSVPLSKKNQRLIAADIFFSQKPINYLIGVGTGNVQDYLDKKYRYYLETRNRTAFSNLNYHNQYFQTTGDTGILGLTILTIIFIYYIRNAKNRRSNNYLIFIIITIFFFSVESFFETQRGVMNYIIFNCFYLFLLKD